MKKILLVDDEKDFLYPMGELLQNRGYTVFTASSYPEALEILKNTNIEICVTDIILPGQDGFELMMMLNDDYPDIKIVAISGGGRVDKLDYLSLAKGLRADATLAKPFLIDELENIICTL
jgi:CheY-like chemotaxis protein